VVRLSFAPWLPRGDVQRCFKRAKELRSRHGSVAFSERPPHGSLLIMAGNTEKHFKHEVPKEPDVTQPRINLTFRHIEHKWLPRLTRLMPHTAIRARPINSPATARYRHPEQPLRSRIPRIMVERTCSLIESPRVPRVAEPKFLEIKMVAKLVAERAQECAEGRDLFANCSPHPRADHHGFGIVVPEFARPVFAHSQPINR